MSPLQRIDVARIAPVRWRNGAGLTRELLRLPAPAGDAPDGGPGEGAIPDDNWLLRISLADIEQDCVFSAFPGVRRWFAVVSGAGVRLHFPGPPPRALQMTPGVAPVRFEGGEAPACTLLDGPGTDLNLMLRDGAGDASLRCAHPGEPWTWRGPLRALFTRRPLRLLRSGQTALTLPAGQLVWTGAGDDEGPWRIEDPDDAAPADPAGWWIGWCRPSSPL